MIAFWVFILILLVEGVRWVQIKRENYMIFSSVINGGWWKAKIQPYTHAIAAYGTTIVPPFKIAYGGWRKKCMPVSHGGYEAAI